MVATRTREQEIEEALVGHWSHFGRWRRGSLVEESGTLRYETPIPNLPYNGVTIYGMSVRPEARGRGIAAGLTTIAVARAKELGCARVVLHSSEMAVGVYERAGFEKVCDLTAYADAPLWASRHH